MHVRSLCVGVESEAWTEIASAPTPPVPLHTTAARPGSRPTVTAAAERAPFTHSPGRSLIPIEARCRACQTPLWYIFAWQPATEARRCRRRLQQSKLSARDSVTGSPKAQLLTVGLTMCADTLRRGPASGRQGCEVNAINRTPWGAFGEIAERGDRPGLPRGGRRRVRPLRRPITTAGTPHWAGN